tara:strand:+ start:270 stop:533 length:264 start_codon:yes stop_codon:yes gene_type:complete
MFRKEFLEQYPNPLCSDGFSGFIINDPDYKKHNDEITKATEFLETDLLPTFAKEFSGIVLSCKDEQLDGIRVTEEMHAKGINMRYVR